MQDPMKTAQRNTVEKRVVIDEVNMTTGFISAHDASGGTYQISTDSWLPAILIPTVGSVWIIGQRGAYWILLRRFDLGTESTKLTAMQAGDVRLEAQGSLSLNGVTILVNGTEIHDIGMVGPVGPIGPVGPPGPVGSNNIPSGAIMAYAISTAPAGWHNCDGSSQIRTDPIFSPLFAAIGTTYGTVDGTHFNLPDSQGRMIVGLAGAGGNTDVTSLAANDGATLANRRPKHSHGLGSIAINASGSHGHTFTGSLVTSGSESVTHTHSGTTGFVSADHSHNDSGHVHGPDTSDFSGAQYKWNVTVGTGVTDQEGSGNQTQYGGTTGIGNAALGGITANHTHTFTSGTQSVAHTHQVTAAGSISTTDTHSHSNGAFTGAVGTTASAPTETPSYLVLNYIIKL